jgi:predicted RND superfamily exporter protein
MEWVELRDNHINDILFICFTGTCIIVALLTLTFRKRASYI